MTIARYIVLSSWMVFYLYWLVSARTVKRTKEVQAGFRHLRWIGTVIAILVLLFMRSSAPSAVVFSTRLIPNSILLLAVGAILTVVGLAIAIAARRTLGGNWSSNVVLKEGHELMTTGLYRYVRHPIYSGVLLMALGSAVVVGQVYAVTFFVLVLMFFAFKASQEEKLLTKHFPDEYPAYKSRVKAIIPFVW